jgi:predicted GNAT family acetyltransferase
VTALSTSRYLLRRLGPADGVALRRLIDADPFVNVVLASRLEAGVGLDSGQLGGELLGIDGADGLVLACFRGGTVLPVGGDPALWRALATQLGVSGARSCSSLVAPTETVAVMWPLLAPYWGPARLVREHQPLLVLDRDSRPANPVTPDLQVRPVLGGELDRYLPAAEAMFAEELGLAPFSGVARRSFRQRVSELIDAQRVFVRLDRQGRVAFKAEIGAVSRATCQIQGVWVRPDLRGRGLGTRAVATVVEHALRLAPTASLYVNEFNVPARRLYERLGMREVATLATVLF